MELLNNLTNNLSNVLDLKNIQDNFLKSTIGQIANSAIDFGIKNIMPDFIENDIIEIKDSLISGGIQEGINTAIENAIDLGKNVLGISNNNYETIEQAQNTIEQGALIEGISNTIDSVLEKLENSNIISNNVSSIIQSGKDLILGNINNDIENEFTTEIKALEKIKKYINNWEKCYTQKDREGLLKEFNKIEKQMKKILPLENILNNVEKIKNINELINNNENFDFDKIYLDLAEKI